MDLHLLLHRELPARVAQHRERQRAAEAEKGVQEAGAGAGEDEEEKLEGSSGRSGLAPAFA